MNITSAVGHGTTLVENKLVQDAFQLGNAAGY
jgi:hypothetical protein